MTKTWHAFGVTFTDVFEIHEKIDVNIAGDVWQKRGGRTFANRPGCREKQIILIFVEKALVLKVHTISGVPTGTEPHEER